MHIEIYNEEGRRLLAQGIRSPESINVDGCPYCNGLPVRGVIRDGDYVMVQCDAADGRREACNECGGW